MRKRLLFWRNLDWTKTDTELAKKLGCSYPTVRNWRKKLKFPSIYEQNMEKWRFWDWNSSTEELVKVHKFPRYKIRKIRIQVEEWRKLHPLGEFLAENI